MATINLGSIKFNWRGSYAAGTAYSVDDVVSYQGSSFVCILASTGNVPTNTTYWNVFAEGGDVATTLTTQGDILYRDGSGLARLAAGTSGQFLKTQGSGANPVWGSVVAGLVQVVSATSTSSLSSSDTSGWVASNLTVNITPTSASNKIFVMAHGSGDNDQNGAQVFISIFRGSTNLGSSNQGFTNLYANNSRILVPYMIHTLDTPNSTSQQTYTVYAKCGSSPWEINGQGCENTITAMEVAV